MSLSPTPSGGTPAGETSGGDEARGSRVKAPGPASLESPASAEALAREPGRRGHWYSGRRAQAILFAVCALLVETVPVWTVLQLFAGYVAGTVGAAALPLWYLFGLCLVAYGLGRLGRDAPPLTLVVRSLPFFAVAMLVGWRISPAGYAGTAGGPLDLGWLWALATDLAGGTSRLEALFGLTVVGGYLWWRGLRMGAGDIGVDAQVSRFKYALVAVIIAVVLAAALHQTPRAVFLGRMALVLPLVVFVGLVAVALARAREDPRQTGQHGWSASTDERQWFGLAVALAGAVVVIVLLVSLLVSYDSVLAFVRTLGPVGAGLNALVNWVLFGFAYLLFLILGGPIQFLTNLVNGHQQKVQPPQPPSSRCTQAHPCPPPKYALPSGGEYTLVLAIVLAAVLIVIGYVVYRSLRDARLRRGSADDAWEEREALDGGSLFGAQVRGLFESLFGRRGGGVREEELAEGSVRRVYRDLLRAGAAVGIGRRLDETADEYGARLEAALASPGVVAPGGTMEDDSVAVAAVYDEARYGGAEPDGERARDFRARVERLTRRVRAGAALRGVGSFSRWRSRRRGRPAL